MSNRTILVLAVAAVTALAVPWRAVNAQRLAPGPQVLTFFSDVDDSEQPYGLYLPKNYNEKTKYPLVIMLHGAQSNHRLSLKRVFGFSNQQGENDLEASRYFQDWADVGYIVASPLARGTMGYKGIPEKDVWDVVADVKRRFNIDEDRTYLTGLSMGGGGTLWIGLTRPDVWAAIAPVCPAPPFGTVERAPNVLNVPVHFFQGGADPTVNPEGTRAWRKRLEDLGTKVEYVEYPGVAHNSWEKAYAGEAIFKWFAQFKRNRFPDRVRYVTDSYRYGGAYWVKFDKLTPGTFAKIDAQFKAPNRIEIATSDLDAFTLNLAGHSKYAKGRPVEIAIDGASLKATGDSISLTREGNAWKIGKYDPPPTAKRAGLEGPLGSAIDRRHIYVYGTAGSPSREEAQARRDVANRAAAWGNTAIGSGRLLLNMRAVSDTQVRPSDLQSSDLFLFGTKETNNAIAKVADQLPLHLNPTAEGYGLVYVYPVNGHYFLVGSGTPWFPLTDPVPQFGGGRGAPPAQAAGRGGQPGGRGPTGAPQPNAPAAQGPAGGRAAPGPGGAAFVRQDISLGIDFFAPAQRALTKWGDFILYKDTPTNILVQGRFDGNWKLKPEDAEKLAATGVVTVSAAAR
jgi:poly(3-hydroxybutyrate) depolymerase